MRSIDLNCDMGELPEAIAGGTQESLMPYLTSVNVACGGHAGDRTTMRVTVEQALRHGLAIGAHPGYPDPANFGRLELEMLLPELADSIARQVSELAEVAAQSRASLTHLKPHGALYNQAAAKPDLARAIVEAVSRVDRNLILVGLAGSRMLDVFRDAGFAVAAEGFCDRAYEPDGSLRPRRFADALIRDPERAAAQALRMARTGKVIAWNGAEVAVEPATLCIHGDTPGANGIAEAVARALRANGVELAPLHRTVRT